MEKTRFSRKTFIVFVSIMMLMGFFPYQSFSVEEGLRGLFSEASGEGKGQIIDQTPTLRQRWVSIDMSQLCELEKEAYQLGKISPRVLLNLFDDIEYIARINWVEKTFSGGISLIGDVENNPGSEVIFIITGGVVSANITVLGTRYQVRYVKPGVHRILEVDMSAFPSELPPLPAPSVGLAEDDNIPMDSGAYIDIMVVYTATARTGVGGTAAIENLIDLAVSETNTGYGNSGVTQRLRLVHTAEVDYSESSFNWSTTLSRLRQTSDGYMDDVHTLRNTYGADEVVLIVNNASSCGIGYVMQTVTTSFAPYAFAVVSKNCATGYYSLAHELGHNMGCAHDRDNASVLGAYDYSYGYQAPDEAFRTIMAYNCSGGCTRVNYWSNPDKLYGGQPMGVIYTDPEAADNRRTLNNTAYTVANFRQAVTAPTITVTSPNGGETLTAGDTTSITWSSTGTVGNVRIQYSTNSGSSWSNIVSSTTNDGSYNWTVPTVESSQCRVRVSEASDGDPEDASNANFTIAAAVSPTITVISPIGGETLPAGSSSSITWSTTGTVGNVKIEYSTNNGGSWSTITSSTANDGTHSWTVPSVLSSQCLVKVSEASDGDPTDSSDAVFSIVSASSPTITVTSPNGGESITAGSSTSIAWSSTGTVGNVRIQYSTNNGSSWSTITSSTANDGTHSWTVPSVLSSQCLVKVSEASDGDPTDSSDAVFSIVSVSSPTITVTSPNGGESITAGSSTSIAWSSTGTVGNVRIQYSTNGGSSWSNIITSTANDGSYSWTVPSITSSQCRVKVSEASDGDPQDSSNANFSIVSASSPTITVTSPNGGETLTVGSSTTITWYSTGTVGNVKIQYSTNGGSSWSNIVSSTVNDGSYSWMVPTVESSQCLVKVGEASDGNPYDISNNEFAISSAVTPAIEIITPNGGENLEGDSAYDITWTTSGSVGNVKIEYSRDNGINWNTISSSTSNDGSYTWTVPNRDSTNCLVKVSKASSSSPSDVSDSTFTIYSPTPAEIALSRRQLFFGANISGTVTSGQSFFVENSGGSTLEWSVSSEVSWISASPGSGKDSGLITISVNPSGLGVGSYNGTISVTDSEASNSPQNVSITLNVYQTGQTIAPFGEFATPVSGSDNISSIPVSGWVVDDIEVKSVKIYNGSNYVGDAVFVEGARPDVEQSFPGYPKNYQAGWGYMLLSNFLPGGGNGQYTLYAKAIDAEGNEVNLGSKTIHINNANAVKPFGAIDTPQQGGDASGSNYINWGWVLTPQPNQIPVDGSTINVYVDGVKLGNPTYNIYRSDIASLFPGYANTSGAVGRFTLDTTVYENGVHTIFWTASDNAGNSDGIGSRYFTISNTSINRDLSYTGEQNYTINKIETWGLNQLSNFNFLSDDLQPIQVYKGYDKNCRSQHLFPTQDGDFAVELRELERIVIQLGVNGSPDHPELFNEKISSCQYKGYIKINDQLKPLPTGSSFDRHRGVFYWQPGPGYLGNYQLIFIYNLEGNLYKKNVRINISPLKEEK